MTVYSSVRITTVLLCDCSVYEFPHSVGKKLCVVKIPTFDKISLRINSVTQRQIDRLSINHREKA